MSCTATTKKPDQVCISVGGTKISPIIEPPKRVENRAEVVDILTKNGVEPHEYILRKVRGLNQYEIFMANPKEFRSDIKFLDKKGNYKLVPNSRLPLPEGTTMKEAKDYFERWDSVQNLFIKQQVIILNGGLSLSSRK